MGEQVDGKIREAYLWEGEGVEGWMSPRGLEEHHKKYAERMETRGEAQVRGGLSVCSETSWLPSPSKHRSSEVIAEWITYHAIDPT